jgi:hypothetical protein
MSVHVSRQRNQSFGDAGTRDTANFPTRQSGDGIDALPALSYARLHRTKHYFPLPRCILCLLRTLRKVLSSLRTLCCHFMAWFDRLHQLWMVQLHEQGVPEVISRRRLIRNILHLAAEERVQRETQIERHHCLELES